MQTLHAAYSSVVGIPSKSAWSTTAAWHFDTGSLFATVAFWGDEQAPHDGRRFIGALSQGDQVSSSAEIYQKLRTLSQDKADSTYFSGSFLWVQGTAIFIVSFGHARVAVQRAGTWRWIISGNQVDQVLQGSLQDGDIFAGLTSAGAELSLLTQTEVADPEMAATLLMPVVQRLENQAEVAVQIVSFSSGVEQIHQPVTIQPEVELLEETAVPQKSHYSLSHKPAPSHLISPARLSQGVQAADVVIPRQRGIPKWWKFMRWERKDTFPKIKVLRVLAIVGIISAVLGTVIGVRIWRVNTERAQIIAPLITAAQEVSAYPEDQRFMQRDAARSLLERLQATKVSFRTNQREVQALIAQVQILYDQTAAESNIVNLPVYFDFRLVESSFLATRASVNGDEAVFLDPTKNSALRMDLATKKTERIETTSVASSQDVALSGSQIFWTSAQNVIRTALSGTDATTLHTWSSDRNPQLIEHFGTNVYVMDTASQQLWRIDAESPASPSAWIRSARGVDLSSISSLTIDGEIWLGSREGDIYRLAQGERRDFAPTGLLEPLSSTVLLASSVDGNILAVVEPATQRVVFINKDTGEYIRQVKSQQIGAVTDVFWGAGEQQLYLVAGSVVYRVE